MTRDEDRLTGAGTAGEAQGREKIERFKAPPFIREDLTRLALQNGSAIWGRPGLEMKLRSLATIATLATLGRRGPLREHIELGLDNGLRPGEICEGLLQVGFYAGMPAAVEAMEVADEVFAARGIAGPG